MTTAELQSLPLEALRARSARAKAYTSSLRTELEDHTSFASSSAAHAKPPSHGIAQSLIDALAESEQRLLFYRTTAWSLFEFDLDVGQRARNAVDNEAAPNLALGVRLDTFYDGRFFAPVYLLLDTVRPASSDAQQARITSSTIDAPGAQPDLQLPSLGLRVLNHTVPAQIQLRPLIRKYFARRSPAGGQEAANGARGLNIRTVRQLGQDPAFELFLSDLHSLIQIRLSRREQAFSLKHISVDSLLGLSDPVAPLELLAADGTSDTLDVRWKIPLQSLSTSASADGHPRRRQPLTEDMDMRDDKVALADLVNKGNDSVSADEKAEDSYLRITIHYIDPYADQLNAPLPSTIDQPGPSPHPSSTATGSGTVRVEKVDLFSPARRGEPQRRVTHRRPDLERYFCAPHEDDDQTGTHTQPRDLRGSVEAVMKRVWEQMLENGS